MTPNYPSIGDEHLKALGFGLAGAHRTGKTTVAKLLAEQNRCPLIQVSLSQLATDMGLKIGLDMPFSDRHVFQERGLDLMTQAYSEFGQGGLFMTDRTPMDLAAYVITAWHPAVATMEETEWASDYVSRCIDATNAWLFQLGVIQPGIPWVDDAQKGEQTPFYREALNSTIIGLCMDTRTKPATYVVDRDTLDLHQRAAHLTRAYSESITEYSNANTAVFPVQ